MDIEIPVGKRTTFYRFFEILPAIVSYTTLIAPVALSLINPLLGALFILIYIMSFTVRAVGMSFRTIQGYRAYDHTRRLDWAGRLHELDNPTEFLEETTIPRSAWDGTKHHIYLERLAASTDRLKSDDVVNIVIITAFNESYDILAPTLKAVAEGTYPAKKLVVALAYEERGGAAIEETIKRLEKEFQNTFRHLLVTKHPDGLPYEVKGKGGNITFAGRAVAKWCEEQAIDPHHAIVTTLDADNRPHRQFFTYLTYHFIAHPDPKHVSFQPLTLYLNNIWDVPAAMRVIATGNSFWNIINSFRPNLLRNFSSHSQSLAALIEMDFWSVRTIVEDGHQFWRSYFHFDGYYRVEPLYLPIYQDAVLAETYRKTLIAQFKQLRRWAYGASDIPYVAERIFTRKRTVPLLDGLEKFVRLVEGHVGWATSGIIILLGAWVPLLVNTSASQSIVAHQLPDIVSSLQRLVSFGLIITIFLTFKMLPPRPARYKRRRNFFMLAQWLLMPITSICYGSAAALAAQTHLLLGRYLDLFDVTDKAIVDKQKEN